MQHRILLVDDHPVVRRGLAGLFDADPVLSVVGEVGNAEQAQERVAEGGVDLVVCDVSLPGVSGLTLVKELRASHPRMKLLVLSVHDELVYAERALRAGADGYLSKSAAPADLIAGVHGVMSGGVALSDAARARAEGRNVAEPTSPAQRLSDRELEIFELTGRGHGTRRVAEMLGISIKTVETHKSNIRAKLGLADAGELLRAAVGWSSEVDARA